MGLSTEENYNSLETLTEEVKGELNWWEQKETKGKAFVSTSPQVVVASDMSLRGLGAFCLDQKNGGPWTALE